MRVYADDENDSRKEFFFSILPLFRCRVLIDVDRFVVPPKNSQPISFQVLYASSLLEQAILVPKFLTFVGWSINFLLPIGFRTHGDNDGPSGSRAKPESAKFVDHRMICTTSGRITVLV